MTSIELFLFNTIFWVLVHFLSGYLSHFIPTKFYNKDKFLFKKRFWEFDGNLYSSLFLIKRWKDKMPEAGEFFKIHPFSKKHLVSLDKNYLERFSLETCRAEVSHLLPILLCPISFFWNNTTGIFIMSLYAVLANFPFIIIQRYNRIRLVKLLVRLNGRNLKNQ